MKKLLKGSFISLCAVLFFAVLVPASTVSAAELPYDAFEKYGKTLPWAKDPASNGPADFMVLTRTPLSHLTAEGYIAQDFARNGGDLNTIGYPAHAISDGTVVIVSSGYNGGLGNYVVLEHGNGFYSRYSHLHELVLNQTDIGNSIRRGQEIGYIGTSGNATGANLEFTLYFGGYGDSYSVYANADGRPYDGFFSAVQPPNHNWVSPVDTFQVNQYAAFKSTTEIREDDPGNPWDPPVIDALDRYLENYGYMFPSGMIAEPVNTALGTFVHRNTDIHIHATNEVTLQPGVEGLTFERFYNSSDFSVGLTGEGWSTPFDIKITPHDDFTYSVTMADGRGELFQETDTDPATYTPTFNNLTEESFATLERLGETDNFKFKYTRPDGTVFIFNSDVDTSTAPSTPAPTWGKIESITSRNGASLSFSYLPNGDLDRVIDHEGNWISFSFGGDRLLDSVSASDGSQVLYNYNFDGQLASVTKANGGVWHYGYDSNGYIDYLEDAEGKIVVAENVYDDSGRVISQTDGNGGTTTFEYLEISEDEKITNVTDPMGNVTSHVHNAHNYLVAEALPHGGTIEKTYDERGNVLSYTDENGSTTAYEYDSNGNRTKEIYADGYQQTIAYNGHNLPTTITDESGTIRYEYNAAGRATKMIDQTDAETRYEYNAENLLTKKIEPNGDEISYEYNTAGLLTKEINHATGVSLAYEYDNSGNRTAVVDANGNRTTMTYNNLDKVETITDAKGGVKSFVYDANGNVISEIDEAGEEITYASDDNENIVEITYPYEVTYKPYKQIEFLEGSDTLIDEKFNTTLGRWHIEDEQAFISGRTLRIEDNATIASVWLKPTKLDTEYHFSTLYKTTNSTDPTFKIELYDDNFKYVQDAKPLGENWNNAPYAGWDNEYQDAFYFADGGFVDDVWTDIAYAKLIIETHADSGKKGITFLDDIYLGHNNRPIAKTLSYKEGWRNPKIILDATASFDYESGLPKVYWKQIRGLKVNLENANSKQAYFEVPQTQRDEVLTFRLIVEDKKGVRSIVQTLDVEIEKNANTSSGHYVNLPLQDDFVAENDPTLVIDENADPITKRAREQFQYDANNNLIWQKDRNDNFRYHYYDAANRKTGTDYYNKTGQHLRTEQWNYDKAGNVTAYTDGEGNTTAYQYDSQNRLIKTTRADGSFQHNTYNILSQLTEQTDWNGEVYTFEYDALGRRITEIDPAGFAMRYVYNAKGNLVEEVDALGNKTTYEYDAADRVSKITNAEGFEATYTYDNAGNVLSQTNFAGETTTFGYDANNNLISSTDALGNTIRYEFDARDNLSKFVDGNGSETRYEYHAMGWRQKEINALGAEKVLSYDANGNLIKLSGEDGNSIFVSYDGLNRTTQEKDQTGATTSYEYDAEGNVVAVTDKLGNTTHFSYDTLYHNTAVVDALGNETAFEFDDNGNLLSSTNALGHTTTFTYDSRNLQTAVTNAKGDSQTFTYDQLGRVLEYTDFRGLRQAAYEYDALGNIIKSIDAVGNETIYSYDGANRLTSQTNLGEDATIQTQYDAAGRVLKEINAEGNETVYSYDAAGNVTAISDPNGHATTFSYDALGRQISQTDAAGYTKTLSYDAVGNVVAETDKAGHTTNYSYDSRNMLTAQTNPDGGALEFSYNEKGELVSLTNPRGLSTTFEYDALGRNTKTTYADDSFELVTYDELGRITAITNPNGNTSSYSYDALGNVVTQTDAEGFDTTYEYDANSNIVKTIDANGNEWRYTIDNKNRIYSEADPLGNSTTYDYDSLDRIIEVEDALENNWYTQYDKAGRVIAKIDANDNTTNYAYDAAGNVISKADAAGNVTQYSYDSRNMLTAETDPLGKIEAYIYDGRGLQTRVTNRNGAADDFVYDSMGNLAAYYDALGNQTTYGYDLNQNKIQETDANRNTTTYAYDVRDRQVSTTLPGGETFSQQFDANGNVTKEIDAAGNESLYLYNARDLLTTKVDAIDNAEEYGYDALGNLVTVTDPLGAVTKYQYDARNLLVSVDTPADFGPDRAGFITQYEYDGLGRRIKDTDANGHETMYSYDGVGNMLSETNPLGNSWNYTYNSRNLVETETTPNGDVATYEYDQLDRVAAIGYGVPFNNITYEYDNVGNVTGVLSGSTIQRFGYTARNELAWQNQEADAHNSEATYQFDELGNRTNVTFNDGREARFNYDSNNKLSALSVDYTTQLPGSGAHTESLETTFSYNANQLLVTQQNPNDTQIEYTYDGANRITSVTNSQISNGEILADTNFILDGNGNKTTEHVYRNDSSEVNELSRNYEYDARQQLTKVTQTGYENYVETYSYDAVGNRTQQTIDAAVTDYTYNEANQLIEDSRYTYGYDANGNRTSKVRKDGTQAFTFDYSVRNELINTTSSLGSHSYNVNYTYDGLGRRMNKRIAEGPLYGSSEIDTIRFSYDGTSWEQLEEYYEFETATDNSHENFVSAFVDMPSQPTLLLSQRVLDTPITKDTGEVVDMQVNYFHRDGIGSVVGRSQYTYELDAELGSPSAVFPTHDTGRIYKAFGAFEDGENRLYPTPQSFEGNSRTYSQKGFDMESQMYYYGSRYYDSQTGTWASQDTYRGEIANPISTHRYAFVHNNPVNGIDWYGYWLNNWINNPFYNNVYRNNVAEVTGLNQASSDFTSRIDSQKAGVADARSESAELAGLIPGYYANMQSAWWGQYNAKMDYYEHIVMQTIVGRVQARGYDWDYGQVSGYMSGRVAQTGGVYAVKQQQYTAASNTYYGAVDRKSYLDTNIPVWEEGVQETKRQAQIFEDLKPLLIDEYVRAGKEGRGTLDTFLDQGDSFNFLDELDKFKASDDYNSLTEQYANSIRFLHGMDAEEAKTYVDKTYTGVVSERFQNSFVSKAESYLADQKSKNAWERDSCWPSFVCSGLGKIAGADNLMADALKGLAGVGIDFAGGIGTLYMYGQQGVHGSYSYLRSGEFLTQEERDAYDQIRGEWSNGVSLFKSEYLGVSEEARPEYCQEGWQSFVGGACSLHAAVFNGYRPTGSQLFYDTFTLGFEVSVVYEGGKLVSKAPRAIKQIPKGIKNIRNFVDDLFRGGEKVASYKLNPNWKNWSSYMSKRGWTHEAIDRALRKGARLNHAGTNHLNAGNTMSRVVDPLTGKSLIIDDVTDEIIMLGGDGFKF